MTTKSLPEAQSLVRLEQIKQECMVTLLSLYHDAHAGHIGSALSCLEILIYLYFAAMNEDDQFILSKGHAAAGLYTVLNKAGFVSDSQLATYYQDGTFLAAHPPCGAGKCPGITFGTGSLGHGLSLATGLAFANQLAGNENKVYCVLSDGDCNEGSTWEAVMFAAHHHLKNLVVIIDNNGLQGLGKTEEVIDMGDMSKKWEAFDFEVLSVKNGNDFADLTGAFAQVAASVSEKPKCIIAKTTKGSGVTFMENKLEWHYLPLSDEQYQQAVSEAASTPLVEARQ